MESDHSYYTDEILAQLIIDRSIPGFGQEDDPVDETIRTRATNKKRPFVEGDLHFDRIYFNVNCIYDNFDFERRFRMSRVISERALEEIHGMYLFVLRYDTAKRRGISPRMRLIAALRVLAYGKSSDEVDELVAASASSVREIFSSFTEEVVNVLGQEYLRHPTETDLKLILGINSQRVFPGCVGSCDCQHWPWKNCPVV